jgi:hypothetical protein
MTIKSERYIAEELTMRGERIFQLEKQNADLLEALKAMVDWYGETEDLSYMPQTLINRINKAIAQAEGSG